MNTPKFDLRTRLTPDGKIAAIILNKNGKAVGRLKEPMDTAEEALIAARNFAIDNPDLFADEILVDTPAETENKNPDLFAPGGLSAVPES